MTAPGSSVSATEAADKEGGKQDVREVVFYCKAGVRSRAAARLARGWEGEGVRVGEYKGSWVEWVGRGGVVEQ
jgi:rhodanese-related sulfurtransferase